MPEARFSIPQFRARKNGEKIVVLTAYSTPMARLLDPFVDVLLVGDSLGMALYGADSTLGVTLDMMMRHGQAVMRGSQKAMVLIDMPFGSYQESPQQAYRNAAKLLAETGAAGVKLEGGAEMVETVHFLVRRGIPVIAHIGLMPQHVRAMGGFRTQGKDEASALRLVEEARQHEEAGAFALLIEGTRESVSRHITESVSIPTIGIGASPACDGQVLVTEDILGLSGDYVPGFVRRYADISPLIGAAAKRYAEEVRSGAFPGKEHVRI